MLRNKDLYTITCEKCGSIFYSDKKRAKLCEGCKKKNMIERNRRQSKNNKKPKIKETFLTNAIPIRQYTAIIERYNQQHGTYYTYGQFVSLVGLGKINISKEIKNARLSAQE